MSYRMQREPVGPALSVTRQARNVMVASLVVFLVVAVLALIAGIYAQRPPQAPLGSPTYLDYTNEANSLLSSYGWVDRQAGQVHIPIDRAIELLSERGLPARP